MLREFYQSTDNASPEAKAEVAELNKKVTIQRLGAARNLAEILGDGPLAQKYTEQIKTARGNSPESLDEETKILLRGVTLALEGNIQRIEGVNAQNIETIASVLGAKTHDLERGRAVELGDFNNRAMLLFADGSIDNYEPERIAAKKGGAYNALSGAGI